ncbi:DUF2332 domain-containing protein [Catenulispora sp. NF23]|uniref:DUF2332 domain-containing protein n=1 Tax=Catenulispora pinistramenti TaxID=2705254 RepID=UPI001BA9AA5B|nr:DUF2332 domain-containing protein [Catenulispora pinistramenti]MBS2535946.1 DUF2332 domain-containing protein [Catenulispora pinistramenti]
MTDLGGTPRDLVPVFEGFHGMKAVQTSPLYEHLNTAFITEPELAAALLAAPPTERLPLLLFASVHFLLRNAPAEGDAALAAYYPSLGGSRAPDSELTGTFREFTTRRDTELRALTSTRVTQTNEARRAAMLRPALTAAQRRAGDREIALVEVGCSSGLMLLPDRYGYRYDQPDGSVLEFGDPATPELLLQAGVRGDKPVPEWLATPLRIASRVGIDRNPISADDTEQTDWLRACIWPEHLDRLARLEAALAQAREAGLDLRRGDLLDLLPAAVAEAPRDAVVVVVSSHVLPYLADADRTAFAEQVAELAATRDLMLVLNEDHRFGRVFGVEAPGSAGYVAASFVDFTAADFTAAEAPTATALAKVDPHGTWLEWL